MNLKSVYLIFFASFFLLVFAAGSFAKVLPVVEGQAVPVRAFHLHMVNVSPEQARGIVKSVSAAGFNVLIIYWRDRVRFDNYPVPVHHSAWPKSELLDLVGYSRSLGMDVVPAVHLLTHQEKFFKNHFPDLMYNNTTYDPRKPEVYKKVYPYLDEIISTIRPSALLISHDEVAGFNRVNWEKKVGLGKQPLPADLYLLHVKKINDYLNARGVQTWMWGDMLIARDEFPDSTNRNMHGQLAGYGKSLRQQIPRNIVICDWHYGVPDKKDILLGRPTDKFLSVAAFRKDGFLVLGASWKDPHAIQAFSRQAAEQGASGMIATTWFHVSGHEWDVVNMIISESGKAFLRDFPDPKPAAVGVN